MILVLLLLQEGALDVVDGETLYEGGWLFSASYGVERAAGRTDHTIEASAHYGLRHDVQLGLLVPYVFRSEGDDSTDGFGDVALYGKWRFQRWDGPGWALNCAVIGGVEFPTGQDNADVPPDLQSGSGSWDPFFGAAATYEPGRWRVNVAVLHQVNGLGARNFELGDQFFAELALGNRFWLEPYPGPFMRLDLVGRYRYEDVTREDGVTVPGSGRELITFGANWAFRPRPTLDFQLYVGVPVFQRTDREERFLLTFTFGYRI